MHHLIQNIAMCIAAAWLLGMVAQWLRQPVLLAYLVGGFLLGPYCLKWVVDSESIETISELGLIFLLFMIGLEIDLKKIIAAGSRISVTAMVQIVGGCLLGVAGFSSADSSSAVRLGMLCIWRSPRRFPARSSSSRCSTKSASWIPWPAA